MYISELKTFFYNPLYLLATFNVAYRKWRHFAHALSNTSYCIALVVENLSVHFNESLWWPTINENPQTKYRKIRATCETLALIASEIFAIQVQYVEQVFALGVVISIYIETNYCRIVLLNTAPTTEIPHNRGMDG